MTYSENLRKIAEAQRLKMEAQQKHQIKMQELQTKEKQREDKFVIEEQKRADKSYLDQQNIDLAIQKGLVEAAKIGADIRLKDSQSLKTQGEALTDAQESFQNMTGEGEGQGKEGEKKAKKPGLFSKLAGMVTGKTQAEVLKKTGILNNRPDDETLAQTAQPEPVAPTDEEIAAYQAERNAETEPEDEDDAVLRDIGLGTPTRPGTPPPDLKAHYPSEYEQIVKERLPQVQAQAQRDFERSLKNVDQYRQDWQNVYKEAQKRTAFAKKKLNETFKLQEELQNNPPLRSQALANINWFGKIGAIIHAGIQGMLQGMGVQGAGTSLLINDLIEKEYQDLLTKYEEEKDSLSSKMNLINLNLGFDKDMVEAEAKVKSQLLGMAVKEYSSALNQLPKASKQYADGVKDLENLKMKYQEQNNNLSKWIYEKGSEGGLKGKDLGDLIKLEAHQMKKREFDLDRMIRNIPLPTGKPGKFAFSKDIKKKIDNTDSETRRIIELSKRIRKKVDTIGIGAGIPWTPSNRKFIELGKMLLDLKTQLRIAITGGGNVSNYEQALMDAFVELPDTDGPLAAAKFFMRRSKGGYNALLKAINKKAVGNVSSLYLTNDHVRKAWGRNTQGLDNRLRRRFGLP